jgi:signal peptidase I
MSLDGMMDENKSISFRWDRIFTTVNGEGERVSYLIPFIVMVLGFTFFNRWRKKKKKLKSQNR